ncbi:HAMP domain-containing methyl-accepting chemotaxis protein [Pantanalinema rosaneae CENA516]|uniref:HAMP domain-containing methyl-accepting chemotaxis protein n=1 Tax=Pantanalinema rosaneae TaxID=1620701 RepID=UPI003D6DB191
MKLSTKMYLGFAIPALILAGVGAYSLYSFSQINRQVGTIYDDRVVPLQQLKTISDQYAITIIDTVHKTNRKLLTPSEAIALIQTAETTIQQNWQAYLNTELTLEEQQLVNQTKTLLTQVNPEILRLKQALEERNTSRIAELDTRLYQVIDPLTRQLHQLTDLQSHVAHQERQTADVVYRHTVGVFIVLLVVALILASLIGFFLSRSIIATLRQTIAALSQTATEIAAATSQQERVAAQQATSVNQTTTTMDELSASSRQSATQAEASNTRAQQALAQSESGMKAVEQTLAGMSTLQQTVMAIAEQVQQLQAQTNQIGTITALVSDLANQTNMLALNAAVEAVRAGEHGKGFAIVAAEIRKLAQQSKLSATKIDTLISDIQTAIQTTAQTTANSTSTVQSGIDLAQNTAAAFDRIMAEIQSVVVSSQQLTLNAQQQAIAISQVVTAMNSLNHAAQETASGISQTKQGIQTLNQTASGLQSMV